MTEESGGGRCESGPARVRRVLIAPLERDGLRRSRRATVEDHAAFLHRLEERLAYLDEDKLAVLAEIVARLGQGPARDEWPTLVVIASVAADLAPPPDEDGRLVVSWMASAAGREAWAEAPEVAVALAKHLRRVGMPPKEFHWVAIRREAAEWRRRADVLAERRRSGWETGPEDAAFLKGLDAARERTRRLVFPAAGGDGSGGEVGA